MKFRILTFISGILLIILQSCNPLSSIQIETIIPAEIDFPGNFNKVVFVNLTTDINHDDITDTLLYNIITEEMSLGFMDAIQLSAGIDSTNFLYVKGFPDRDKLYTQDTVSWKYLENISGKTNADIFIVLDSLNLAMVSDIYTDYGYVPAEYYKYRELYANIYWSVFDIVEKRRLDKYHYGDTLLWDATGYSKVEVERKMPSVERSIREASYYAATDYADRIFPGWKLETRYYFHLGNKDFEQAAQYVKEYKWNEAIDIWEKYFDDIDKEIASRACFNLALANEMLGNLDLAIAWAESSNNIKYKSRTRYYISKLKSRQKELKKLEKQIY
ncbi:DUF6340 family protein [Bacteroidota bacterium]